MPMRTTHISKTEATTRATKATRMTTIKINTMTKMDSSHTMDANSVADVAITILRKTPRRSATLP